MWVHGRTQQMRRRFRFRPVPRYRFGRASGSDCCNCLGTGDWKRIVQAWDSCGKPFPGKRCAPDLEDSVAFPPTPLLANVASRIPGEIPDNKYARDLSHCWIVKIRLIQRRPPLRERRSLHENTDPKG